MFPDLKLIEVLDLDIEEMDLSVRSYNCLKRAGLNTVRDVVLRHKKDGLTKIRRICKRSIEEVVAELTELGILLDRPDEYYL